MLIRWVARCAAALMAAACLGCGGSSTDPSSTSASIAGMVRAASQASQMQVAVSGSALATASDPAGRFRLNDVPAGNVTLLFTGNGATARLPLGRVNAGDHVTITVTVEGSSAHLDSRQDENDDDEDKDEDDNDNEREVEGRIAGLSGTAGCPIVTFTIDATTVATDGSTRFKNVACTALANGLKIEAEGVFSNGVLLAKEIEKD
jgi:Domain of unknown function (DUF5666)